MRHTPYQCCVETRHNVIPIYFHVSSYAPASGHVKKIRTFLATSGGDGLLTWFMPRHQIVTLLAVPRRSYFIYWLCILPFQLTLTYSLAFLLCCKPVCISPPILRTPCVLNTSQVGSRKYHEVLPLFQKPWKQELAKISDWPRRRAVAEFRLCVGRDCFGTHLHRIGIRPDPYCMLCSLHETMDRNHLGRCTALSSGKVCERYWEARTKMMEYWLFSLLLLRDYSLLLGLLCLFWMVLICQCF